MKYSAVKAMLEVATLLGLIVLLAQIANPKETRVIVPRECMTTAAYYKGDCSVEGTLLHCKNIWIEFTCEQLKH